MPLAVAKYRRTTCILNDVHPTVITPPSSGKFHAEGNRALLQPHSLSCSHQLFGIFSSLVSFYPLSLIQNCHLVLPSCRHTAWILQDKFLCISALPSPGLQLLGTCTPHPEHPTSGLMMPYSFPSIFFF